MSEYKIITQPDKITSYQMSKFTKAWLIKYSTGSSLSDIKAITDRMQVVCQSANVRDHHKETNNLLSSLWNMIQGVNLDANALKHLVNCDDEDDAFEWLMNNHSSAELKALASTIKKNFKPILLGSFQTDTETPIH